MGLGSFGFLVGAVASNSLPRSLGVGPTIIASAALSSPAFLLMTLTPPSLGWAAVTLFTGWFVVGFASGHLTTWPRSAYANRSHARNAEPMNATMRFPSCGAQSRSAR